MAAERPQGVLEHCFKALLHLKGTKMDNKKKDRYLIFDESGNLGSSGRYFVISCIDTHEYKSLHNMVKRKLGQAKVLFPDLAVLHSHEVKAKDAYPCVKDHLLECIAMKNLTISYIVADLSYVNPRLLQDKNIFYNYMMKLLIQSLIRQKDNGSTIHIIYDNHTTKVGSVNSLEDYIKLQLIYSQKLDIDLDFRSMDSDSSNAYSVQAADYVANALYSHFEYKNDQYYNRIKRIVHVNKRFPYKFFGK